MSKTIGDATVWLNFARADAVSTMVEAMANRLVVGSLVEREVRTWPRLSRRGGEPFSFQELVGRRLLERAVMTAEELATFHATKAGLHLGDGETEAVVLAASRGWSLATDNGPARARFAIHNPPVRVTGTIGLLRALVRQGAVSRQEATKLLVLMRERGGRLPQEEL